MGKNANFVSHKKSKLVVDGKPKLPSSDSLVEGEIAINFAENVETLSIKNESGDVVTFSSDNYYTKQKLGSAFTGDNSAVTVTDTILWERGTGENSIQVKGNSTQAIGIYSVAEGNGTEASGTSSHAEGGGTHAYGSTSHAEGGATNAYGTASHAEGGGTRAYGTASHAEGQGTNASGNSSHAEGFQTHTYGDYSHVEGWSTRAYGQASHTEGNGTEASGTSSHAEGYGTRSYGDYSHAEGSITTASGDSSHAEGADTKANGQQSHAEGQQTQANGNFSHTEGNYTIASGQSSHAEGQNTIASANFSHAEGYNTIASGDSSHAEGRYTITNNESEHASGQYNVSNSAIPAFGNSGNTLFSIGNGTSNNSRHNAFEVRQNGDIYIVDKEGNDIRLQDELGGGAGVVVDQVLDDTTSASTNPIATQAVYEVIAADELVWANAYVVLSGTVDTKLDASAYTEYWVSGSGENSVAQYGGGNDASGDNSVAEGWNTTASGDYSHAEGNSTSGTGMYSHAEGKEASASGTSSHAEGGYSVANGNYSHAEGFVTVADGDTSHAEGNYTKASGLTSHAEGYQTQANGGMSHAEGSYTKANGVISHAEGSHTEASGDRSHAEGYMTKANGDYSHAEGWNTTASGECSHSEGDSTQANAYASHAEGSYTNASGNQSHAEGNSTIASGTSSHAEGGYSVANGNYSHAEGNATTAHDYASHAEGGGTHAYGDYSHAEGKQTEAHGDYSHAEGHDTITRNQSEHASGQYNISNSATTTFGHSGNTLFSVGNGEYNKRHNAFEIRQNGDIYIVDKEGKDVRLQDELNFPSVDDFFDDAKYEDSGTSKVINFYHGNTIKATINADDFIKDGMIDTVSAGTSGNTTVLVITWNTDASKSQTVLDIGDMFEADNYYTTAQTSGATEISTALGGKVNSATFTGHTADTAAHFTSGEKTAWNSFSASTEASINDLSGQSETIAAALVDLSENKADTTTVTAHTFDTNIHLSETDRLIRDTLTRRTRKDFTASGMTYFVNTLKSAIADQCLEKYGMKVGDYYSVTHDGKTYNYVIAGLNTMKGTSTPYRLNINHIGIIVDTNATQAWNTAGNTYTSQNSYSTGGTWTTGSSAAGYANCDLHYYLTNTVLPNVKTDLGSSNIKSHYKLYSTAVNTSGYNRFGSAGGCSSSWAWYANQEICALSEVQVYGSTVWSSSGYDTGEACRQLDVFRVYNMNEIFEGRYPWLRDVASASFACRVSYDGGAIYVNADSTRYVAALILFA